MLAASTTMFIAAAGCCGRFAAHVASLSARSRLLSFPLLRQRTAGDGRENASAPRRGRDCFLFLGELHTEHIAEYASPTPTTFLFRMPGGTAQSKHDLRCHVCYDHATPTQKVVAQYLSFLRGGEGRGPYARSHDDPFSDMSQAEGRPAPTVASARCSPVVHGFPFAAGARQQRNFEVPFACGALLYYCACRAASRRDSQSKNSSRKCIPASAT